MENEHNESNKILLGLLVGGVVGAGMLFYFRSAQNHRTPILKKVGRTISEVGELLENSNLDSTDVIKNIEKKIPKSIDVINCVTNWMETGITLWKQFNKG